MQPIQQPGEPSSEKAVMGSIISVPESFYDITLSSDEFTVPLMRKLYQAACDIMFDGGVLDPIGLADRAGCDLAAVNDCRRFATDPKRIRYYAERVHQAAIEGKVRRVAAEVYRSSEKGGALLDYAQKEIMSLTSGPSASDAAHAGVIATEMVEDVQRRMRGEAPRVKEVVTGVPPVDEYLALERGNVLTIAGRPSMGKSTLMLWLVVWLIISGERILLFCTEATKVEVVRRLASMLTKMAANRIAAKKLQAPELEKLLLARKEISAWPLWIDDERREGTAMVREIRRLKAKEGITLVVVDYLQNCWVQGVNPNDALATTNAVLFGLSQATLDKPRATLVLLSQLNRGVERREDKRPLMSDLRESGKIEEVSHAIWLLYRAAYYDSNKPNNVLDVAQAKNRNGPVGRMQFRWLDDLGLVDGCLDMFDKPWGAIKEVTP